MKLNGGTRPFSSSLTSNSRGSGTRGGFSGRLTLSSGSSFFLSPSPSFFSPSSGLPSLRLRAARRRPPGLAAALGRHHRLHLLGREAGRAGVTITGASWHAAGASH